MSLHNLADIQRLKDPLKQFQVDFTISSIPAFTLGKVQQKISGMLSGNSAYAKIEDLELRCTSFSYPGTSIKQTETVIAGFRRKLGSLQNKSGTWTCTITEAMDGSILNTIQSWCDIIHNPLNGLRLPSSLYVSTCVVRIKDQNGKNQRTLWLKGFYPISYEVGNFDPSSSEPVNVQVTWNYDWWSETPTSISALGTSSSITKMLGL